MADSYYHSGEEYFDNFQGDFEGCQILGVEQYVELDIRGYTYIGYIDLLVKDDKGYIICDHKSKAGFKTEEEKHDYLRQLYLYSLYVKEQYDEYPYKLIFNMFRKGIWVEEPFQESALQEAVDWFVGNIQKIYQETHNPTIYVNMGLEKESSYSIVNGYQLDCTPRGLEEFINTDDDKYRTMDGVFTFFCNHNMTYVDHYHVIRRLLSIQEHMASKPGVHPSIIVFAPYFDEALAGAIESRARTYAQNRMIPPLMTGSAVCWKKNQLFSTVTRSFIDFLKNTG